MSNPTLHLPPKMKYDCVMCGRGCADFWEIPVDEVSEQRLQPYNLKPHQQRLTESPPFVPSEFDSGKALCRENDVCTFLKENKACALHEALGPKIKPQACIDFPFRYVQTPAGPYVGLSFACTAILQDHGAEVETRRAELEDEYARSIHHRDANRPVKISARISLDFEAYLALERTLDEIFALPGVELSRRLYCAAQFMELVLETFKASRLRGESSVELSVDEQLAGQTASDLQLIETLARRFQADRWGRLLAKSVREKPVPAQHRAFIGLIASYRQALWRGANRKSALIYLARHFITNALMIRAVQLKPLNAKMRPADVKRFWPADVPGSERDQLLTRFFRHALFRKDLLLSENIRAGLQFMLMQFALINWYTVAFSMEAYAGNPPDNIDQEALRTVEKYYGNHSRFTEFLESQPLLLTMLQSIMNNRKYPLSIVSEPFKKTQNIGEIP